MGPLVHEFTDGNVCALIIDFIGSLVIALLKWLGFITYSLNSNNSKIPALCPTIVFLCLYKSLYKLRISCSFGLSERYSFKISIINS